MLDKLKEFIDKVNSMFLYLAENIKTINNRISNVSRYISKDVASLTISVSSAGQINMTLPEDGIYVVTASHAWMVSNLELSTSLALYHNGGNPQATARGYMTQTYGDNVTTIINAKKNDIVTLQITWSGGYGSATAERIRFRAVRIGGGLTRKLFDMLSPKVVIAC